MTRLLLHILRREEGIAMPIAMGAMVVVTLLAVATAQSAYDVNAAADADRSSKRALAAAEAGLQVANNRLNKAADQSLPCFADSAPSAGNCPTAIAGSLGNGATYRYWISPVVAAGETCGSIPTQTATGTQRCITSEGSVNGVVRRVQTRVLNTPGQGSLLPTPGVVGLDLVDIKNNAEISGRVGTNGTFRLKNNTTLQGVDFGQGGGYELEGKEPTFTKDPAEPISHPSKFTLDPVPVGDTATNNQNANFPRASGVTINSQRELILNGADVTLTRSGDYNFCRIAGGNQSTIRLAPGVKVRIFVDAPGAVLRGEPPTSSGCPNGRSGPDNQQWGTILAKNDFELNPGGDPANLQVFVVGWNSVDHASYYSTYGQPELEFKNKFNLNGLLYAPNAAVNFWNNAVVSGGIATEDMVFHNNFDFVWDADSATSIVQSRSYDRQGWRECRPRTTAPGDPESGC